MLDTRNYHKDPTVKIQIFYFVEDKGFFVFVSHIKNSYAVDCYKMFLYS